jgi:hypothetical protein
VCTAGYVLNSYIGETRYAFKGLNLDKYFKMSIWRIWYSDIQTETEIKGLFAGSKRTITFGSETKQWRENIKLTALTYGFQEGCTEKSRIRKIPGRSTHFAINISQNWHVPLHLYHTLKGDLRHSLCMLPDLSPCRFILLWNMANLRNFVKVKFPCARYESIWRSGGTVPLFLNLGSRPDDWSASRHGHFTASEGTPFAFSSRLAG